MTPLEPQKKVLVARDFLDTDHGEIECVTCHGGNAGASRKTAAHEGMVPNPSFSDPEKACGECHEEIAAAGPNTLHRTLAPFTTVMKNRAKPEKHPAVERGLERSCSYCHTGCGGCHVSRPSAVDGGFINGHHFQASSDMLNQCTACHGSRIGDEYLGRRGQGDIHASKANMDCVACHRGEQLHAAAPADLPGRYHLQEATICQDCHKDLERGQIRNHNIHIGKVQCQVCHSQTYTNCYGCHTGTDDKGLNYFINQRDFEGMKIGLAYDAEAPSANFNFMLVRRQPMNPEIFAKHDENVFENFDAVPTWKRTSPHNIQRRTWQTATCNHCHGNRDLFLSDKDLFDYERAANRDVVVSDIRVPARVKRPGRLDIDTTGVKKNRVVNAGWLNQNLGSEKLIIVDARSADAYAKGHIEGAVLLDPLKGGKLRWPWDTPTPQQLLDPNKLARVFGSKGISADAHIVVYDREGWRAAFLLSVLEYCGAENISFLKGGIESWRLNGYPVSTEAVAIKPVIFEVNPQQHLIIDNNFVLRNQANLDVAIVDVRPLDQSKGLAKHARALSYGRIPGTVTFPIGGLIMDHAELKQPEELLWVLRNRGITPDKTVVVTCNTGAWAGAGFFMMRYLGYANVRIHDAAWVGWEEFAQEPGCGY